MASTKLKTLKVAELKDILTSAGVSFTQRANKSDLIAKITASPAALNAFNTLHSSARVSPPKPAPSATVASQNDDLLAPPEDFDWNTDAIEDPPVPSATPVKQVQKTPGNASKTPVPTAPSTSTSTKPVATAKTASSAATAAPPAAPSSTAATVTTTNSSSVEHAAQPSAQSLSAEAVELEKRKKRAERFGIPLVEPGQGRPSRSAKATPVDAVEKLAARAERFGFNNPASTTAQKRTSPAAETVDKEELEKRAKRAKRFGQPAATK